MYISTKHNSDNRQQTTPHETIQQNVFSFNYNTNNLQMVRTCMASLDGVVKKKHIKTK